MGDCFDDDRPNEPRLLADNSIDMYGDGSVLKKILRPGTSREPPTCGYGMIKLTICRKTVII